MSLITITPNYSHIGFGESNTNSSSLAVPTKIKPNTLTLITVIAIVVILASALGGSTLGGVAALYLGTSVVPFMLGGATVGSGTGVAACAAGATAIAAERFTPPENLPVAWNPLNGEAPKPLGEVQPNHSIVYSNSSDVSSKHKLEIIKNATKCVEISGNYVGGKLFRQALTILESKLKASKDFQVHILGVNDLIEEEDTKILESLSKQYPKQFKYLIATPKWNVVPELRKVDNHVKLVVVDENMFVLGGTGFHESLGKYAGDQEIAKDPNGSFKSNFIGRGFRDKDILGQGSAAKTLRWEFFKLFAVWEALMTGHPGNQVENHYFPVQASIGKMVLGSRKANVKVLVSQPDCPNAISAEYIKMIESCKKRILIGQMMISGQEVMAALIHAAESGKDITIVTNGVHEKSPVSHSFMARRNWVYYQPLLQSASKNNVKIHEYAVGYITYHSKIMVVDGGDPNGKVIIGSYNASEKSHMSDYELATVVDSPEVVEEAVKGLMADVALSTPVTLEQATSHQQSKLAHAFNSYLGTVD